VPLGGHGGRVYAGSSKRLPYNGGRGGEGVFIGLKRGVKETTWHDDWRLL